MQSTRVMDIKRKIVYLSVIIVMMLLMFKSPTNPNKKTVKSSKVVAVNKTNNETSVNDSDVPKRISKLARTFPSFDWDGRKLDKHYNDKINTKSESDSGKKNSTNQTGGSNKKSTTAIENTKKFSSVSDGAKKSPASASESGKKKSTIESENIKKNSPTT